MFEYWLFLKFFILYFFWRTSHIWKKFFWRTLLLWGLGCLKQEFTTFKISLVWPLLMVSAAYCDQISEYPFTTDFYIKTIVYCSHSAYVVKKILHKYHTKRVTTNLQKKHEICIGSKFLWHKVVCCGPLFENPWLKWEIKFVCGSFQCIKNTESALFCFSKLKQITCQLNWRAVLDIPQTI